MSVSVALPVRNGMPHLPAQLESIAGQTLAPAEILVADGGSTDGSLEAYAQVPGVRVLDASGITLSASYNLAADAATGNLLAFSAGDDVWDRRKLELQVRALEGGADASVCAVECFLDGPPPPGFRAELLDAPRVMRLPETMVIRRAAYDRVGGFRDAVAPAGDVDWFARAGEAGITFAVVDDVLLHKRVHGASTAHTATQDGLVLALRAAIERRR